jgi:hypothetical protein
MPFEKRRPEMAKAKKKTKPILVRDGLLDDPATDKLTDTIADNNSSPLSIVTPAITTSSAVPKTPKKSNVWVNGKKRRITLSLPSTPTKPTSSSPLKPLTSLPPLTPLTPLTPDTPTHTTKPDAEPSTPTTPIHHSRKKGRGSGHNCPTKDSAETHVFCSRCLKQQHAGYCPTCNSLVSYKYGCSNHRWSGEDLGTKPFGIEELRGPY